MQQEHHCNAILKQALTLLSIANPDKNQLEKAHSLTMNLCQSASALPYLIDVLSSQQPHLHKIASCTIIDNFMRYHTSPTSSINLFSFHATLYAAFLTPSIPNQYKTSLERAYVRLIHYDRSSAIRKDLSNKIGDFFTKIQNLKNCHLLRNMGYLIRCLLHGKIESDLMKELIKHIMDNLGKELLNNMKCVSECLKERDEVKFREKIQMAAIQMEIYKLIFIKTDPDRFPTFKLELISKTELSTLIIVVFQLTLPDADPKFMIESRGDYHLQLINQLKRYSLEIICNCLRVAQKHKKDLIWEKQSFKSLLVTCQVLLKVLPEIMSRQITSYPASQLPDAILFREGLRFISLIIKVPQFYSLAATHRQLILFKLCFQCLLASPSARSKSPQDYKVYRQDIANTSEQVNSIETNISRIIESYVDNIDGSLTILVNTIINLCKFLLGAHPACFQKLPETLINSYFYKQNSFEQQIECGLLILSIVSYRVEGRQDMAEIINRFFEDERQYFCKIDLNFYVRSAFYLLYSYYVDNFYLLIQKGIINGDFHIFIFQLIVKSIGYLKSIESQQPLAQYSILQAYDCISNTINQNLFISCLFHNESSQTILIDTFITLTTYILHSDNINLADIFIEFLKEKLRIHMRDGVETIQPIIRNQISTNMTIKLAQLYPQIAINKTIIREKIFQIFSLILMVCEHPINMYVHLRQFIIYFDKYVDNQYNILECVNTITNTIKQSKQPTNIIIEIANSMLKGFNLIGQHLKYGCLFSIYLNIIEMGCLVEDILKSLMNLFLTTMDISIQQHTAYLIMIIAYSKYELVSNDTWQQLMQSIIVQLEKDYIKQQSCMYGKLVCVVLCCMQNNFNYFNSLFGPSAIQSLWKLILSNQKIYQTYTEQRICCIKLIQFVSKYAVDIPTAKQVIRMAIILTYYGRNGGEVNWAYDHSDTSQQQSDSGEYWEKPLPTLAKNPFLDGLEDEAAKLRDLSNQLLRNDCKWFKEFIEELPIAIKNFLKNRVIMYQEGTSSNSLRRIYKVKRNNI